MGALEGADGRLHPLDTVHRIGRADDADTQIVDPHVSYDHARIFWADGQWTVEDINSRNGTWVDGQIAHERIRLTTGTRLSFGGGPLWRVVDESAPTPWAIDDQGRIHRAQNGLLALPDPQQPERWLVQLGTRWVLEGADPATEPGRRSVVIIKGVPWQLRIPRIVVPTLERGHEVAQPVLVIEHSPDEEHIELVMTQGEQARRLAHRAHGFLLLHLARIRARDEASGAPAVECGWVLPEALLADLRIERVQLNMMVYRARQQFAQLPVEASDCSIIDRRRGSGRIRLGFPNPIVRPIA